MSRPRAAGSVLPQSAARSRVAEGPLALVLGVTGHRDLCPEERPAIEQEVARLFDDLHRRYPHTPLRLLSPLAEGADRLVARVALTHGVELSVPLPFEEAEYRRDFTTPDSQAEFDELRGRAQAVWEVYSLPAEAHVPTTGTGAPAEARERGYEAVGLYLARHVHLLLALWSDKESTARGGTAQIVGARRHGLPRDPADGEALLDPPECGPVWRLPVHRLSEGATAGPLGEPQWLDPDPPDEFRRPRPPQIPFRRRDAPLRYPQPQRAPFEHTAALFEQFNAGALDGLPEEARSADTAWANLGLGVSGSLPTGLGPDERRLLAAYAASDALALRWQRRLKRTWRLIVGFTALMVSSFEFYSHLWPYWYVLAGYPLGFAALLWLYLRHQRAETHDRFLDARALAEGLRVQIYWREAGLGEAVADHYLRRHHDHLSWVRLALRGLAALPPSPAISPTGAEKVVNAWTGRHRTRREQGTGQRLYFARAFRRLKVELRLFSATAFAGYALALFAAVAVIVLSAVGAAEQALTESLLVVMALLPAWIALAAVYTENQLMAEAAEEAERMEEIYARAAAMVDKTPEGIAPADHLRGLLRALGREALHENGEWLALHRRRPPRIQIH